MGGANSTWATVPSLWSVAITVFCGLITTQDAAPQLCCNEWAAAGTELDLEALLACVGNLHEGRAVVTYAWGHDLDRASTRASVGSDRKSFGPADPAALTGMGQPAPSTSRFPVSAPNSVLPGRSVPYESAIEQWSNCSTARSTRCLGAFGSIVLAAE
jgi:hypothetical protein